jgi:hypothetical protein
MSRKRRINKRRASPEVAFQVWKDVLETGFDYFHDLASIGISTDQYGRPSSVDALAAWSLMGPRILAEWDLPDRQPWAEQEFGRPWEKANAR